MEGLQAALGHGFNIAVKISYKVFQNAILKALFIIDEEHLELAIEQNVDLLALSMIYASTWLKYSQQIVSQMGRGAENKITLENSLKWLDEQCKSRRRRYYDIIVNLPGPEVGFEPTPSQNAKPGAAEAPKKVYPPPGADMKRVTWWWTNVQKLIGFVFHRKVEDSTKRWAVEHLKWLAQQKEQGKTKIGDLLEAGREKVAQAERAEGAEPKSS